MSEQHGGDHEHGAAGRNGHMGDSTVQTVQVPGTLEVSGGQYSQGGIGPNQEYRLAPQVGQLDAGTYLRNAGYRVGQMDLGAGFIRALGGFSSRYDGFGVKWRGSAPQTPLPCLLYTFPSPRE